MAISGRVTPRWGVKGCSEGCSEVIRPMVCAFGLFWGAGDEPRLHCAWHTPTPSSIHRSLDLNLILELQRKSSAPGARATSSAKQGDLGSLHASFLVSLDMEL